MSGRMPAQCAPPPQVAGLLCKKPCFLHEARWAGLDARIQRHKLRLSCLEPRAWVQRLALFTDFEVKLWARASAAVTRRGDFVSRGDPVPHRLVEPLVVAVKAHVAVTMI